ncbi:MAG: 30S ribosomal protein S4 [Elusimicrobia bacterium]|nr:30S ribosomal protein S4 [Elusimicrobiota bacterium]MBK7207277.1 30S ribosomal protein S4 [Elusimicrobiota bacterium]MBK7546090.1 30S ribosomal protein S4 [Elusimicrobiota bacterium]MBK7575437.1 30S ribosomal protein S4 [Elusimicrobiota bacterium]MBK7689149.1 30S ribosomal protein S4 [Elusimicrobiota bacterium]
MARYIGPVCKLCRRESVKLFLKGDRCFGKCPMDREGVLPPGQHGARRAGKPTEYAKRLREKQKARRISGVLERQFRRLFATAAHAAGNTGENLLRLLETRLDNVVRRLGFSTSPRAARQLVSHNHVTVNGKPVNISSYQVKPGDRIALVDGLRANLFVKRSLHTAFQRGLPAWLEWDGSVANAVKGSMDSISLEGVTLAGQVKSWPSRQEMSYPVNEQFIVELYSK